MAARQTIYKKFQRVTWADWLRKEAECGNAEALRILRSRAGQTENSANNLSGPGSYDAFQANVHGDVTKHGTIVICAGSTMLRDYGIKLAVTRGHQEHGLQMALRLAVERYGNRLHVDGSEEFRNSIVRAAAKGRLSITFDDAALEARRQELIYLATTKEDDHAIRQQPEQGRSADRSIPADRAGPGEPDTAGLAAASSKPDIGGIGKAPPPASRNGLRTMSEFGVVCLTGRGEVLLPRDVSGDLEQSGTAADHRMRRPVSGAGKLTPSVVSPQTEVPITTSDVRPKVKLKQPMIHVRPLLAPTARFTRHGATHGSVSEHEISAVSAPAKYVLEQEQKRLSLPNIPKHLTYDGFQGQAAFVGLRAVDGQQLALLKRSNEVLVVAVDDATARRLKDLELDAVVQIGAVRRKGISR